MVENESDLLMWSHTSNIRAFWINIIPMSLKFWSIYFIVLAHSNQLKTNFWALLFHAGASLQKKLHSEPQVLSDTTQPKHLLPDTHAKICTSTFGDQLLVLGESKILSWC